MSNWSSLLTWLKSKNKKEVLSYWYTLVPSFECSTKDFYTAVEKELLARKVPDLDISRVSFKEGEAWSADREYLHMTRDRLVFDICAAPFGTAFFFSCRLFEKRPSVLRLVLVVLLLAPIVNAIISHVFGDKIGSILGGILGLYVLWRILRIAGIVGAKDTYYAEDTRVMYLDTIPAVVKQEVEKVTSASGVKLLSQYAYNPILGERYKPVVSRPIEPTT